jgi:hypothetical protein
MGNQTQLLRSVAFARQWFPEQHFHFWCAQRKKRQCSFAQKEMQFATPLCRVEVKML